MTAPRPALQVTLYGDGTGNHTADITGLPIEYFSLLQQALTEAVRRYTELGGLDELATGTAGFAAELEAAARRARGAATPARPGTGAVATLTSAQLATVRRALTEAAEFREMRATSTCEACASLDPDRCAEHAHDQDAYDALLCHLTEVAP